MPHAASESASRGVSDRTFQGGAESANPMVCQQNFEGPKDEGPESRDAIRKPTGSHKEALLMGFLMASRRLPNSISGLRSLIFGSLIFGSLIILLDPQF